MELIRLLDPFLTVPRFRFFFSFSFFGPVDSLNRPIGMLTRKDLIEKYVDEIYHSLHGGHTPSTWRQVARQKSQAIALESLPFGVDHRPFSAVESDGMRQKLVHGGVDMSDDDSDGEDVWMSKGTTSLSHSNALPYSVEYPTYRPYDSGIRSSDDIQHLSSGAHDDEENSVL